MSGKLRESFGPIFDADNHYWETSDAFTRYRSAKFKDRGVRLVEHEGRLRYFLGDKPHPWVPGPGDVNPRPKPGALIPFFSGEAAGLDRLEAMTSEDPKDHPEWYDRDARLKTMDAQGLSACWMFPTHGVCMEGVMQPDVEAAIHIIHGFNRWIDDDWGFSYQDRIIGAPLILLSDVDAAIAELEWAIAKGARLVAMRPGPIWTADGMRSPADPMFDRYWARVEEAGITVGVHPGFADGYQTVDEEVARCWGISAEALHPEYHHTQKGAAYDLPFVNLLQKKRLVRDFACALVVHGLFTRFPRLKIAFIENGSGWVPQLLRDLKLAYKQTPGMFGGNPVDQFHRNVWVAPFVEDDVQHLARNIPVERILFGSDWPHAEGFEHPREFFANLDGFNDDEVRRIMCDNVRELTFA